MKQLLCPLNGLRNISEFTYGGELENMPNPENVDAKQWSEYVFYHSNDIGVVTEWWCHTATTYWFIAKRHTLTDEVIETFDPIKLFNQKVIF